MDPQGLGKLLGVHALDGWKGRLMTVPDSTSALTKGCTAAPRRQTILAVLYGALRPPQYPSMRHEFWLPAQHDTLSAEVPALLNKEADVLARRGAQGALPLTVPLLSLLPHRVIAARGGAILLDTRAVEHVYASAKQQQWPDVAPMAVVPVSATYFVEHVLQGSFTPAEVRLACSHRLLSLRGVPAGLSMLECHFCGALTWDFRDHVFMGCPAHFLAVQEVMYRTLRLATVQASGHLEGYGSYGSGDGRHYLRIEQDREVWTAPSLDPGTHQMVSTTGVWRTWSTDDAYVVQNAKARRLITRAVVKAMTRHEHTLEYLQGRLADVAPMIHPPKYPSVENVHILRPHGSPMPLADSLALGRVLHGLDHWRLVSLAPPTVKLPPRSLLGARQSVLVLCPSAGPPLAMLEHRPTANEHLIVLGSLSQARTIVDLLGSRSHLIRVGVGIIIAVQRGVLLRNDLRDRLLCPD